MWENALEKSNEFPMLQTRREAPKCGIKHLRKKVVQIRLGKKTLGDDASLVSAMMILNEFLPDGLNLFSNTYLAPGEEISVVIRSNKGDGQTLYVKSKVAWIKDNVAQSKNVISQEQYRYRVGLITLTKSDLERAQLNQSRAKLLAG